MGISIWLKQGAALLALGSMPAFAQQPTPSQSGNPPQLEDIVVTAQRRAESLQDVPLSVSAFDGQFLQRSRVATVSDLVAFTPGVSGTTVSTTTPRITVRGVSTEDFGVGSDPALGIYVDDVYLGRGVSSVTDLFDVGRVEVIKGPQGSLFGRNTTAGAISIVTNRPSADEASGYVDASYGRFEAFDARGAVNLPLGGEWAIRLAGSTRHRDDWVENTEGGGIGRIQSSAGRATLGYDGDDLRATGSFEYRSTRNQPGPYVNRVLVSTNPFGPISSNLTDTGPDRARDNIDSYRATLRIEADLSDAVTLTSITAYNGFDNSYLEDTDASPLTLLHFGTDGRQDSYSQELRLNGSAGPVEWFLGASAARDDARSTQSAIYDEEDLCAILFAASCTDATGLPGAPRVREQSIASTRNTSLAIYGDATIALGDDLDLTAGLRVSRDVKQFRLKLPLNDNLLGPIFVVPPSPSDLAGIGSLTPDGAVEQRFADTSVQPRLAIRYRFGPGLSAYASVSRGYKAGGFNQLSPGPAFAPETIWSYEAGLKGELLDRRLRFDLSAYHFRYSDLQVLVDFAGSVVTRNAGSASGTGVEVQVTALPVEGLALIGGLAFQDAQYDAFQPDAATDYSGNSLVRAPRWSANLVADGRLPLGGRLAALARLELSYRSRQYFDPSNRSWEAQGPYALVNASLGAAVGDRWELRAFAQNLTDQRYLVDTSQVIPDLIEYTQRGEPRSYGIQLIARF